MSHSLFELREVTSLGDDRREILSHFTLALDPKKITILVGPNGAGKSTLTSVLADVKRPHSGAVVWKSKTPADFSREERLQTLGYLTESFSIEFPVRIQDFLKLGLILRDEQAAPRFQEARAHFLGDLDLEREVGSLSSGERQRANLARTMVQRPEFLVLDEAVSQLDPHHLAQAREYLLERRRQGLGACLVTHDLNFGLSIADVVVSLSGGKLRYQGALQDWKTSGDLDSLYPGAKPHWVQDPMSGNELLVF